MTPPPKEVERSQPVPHADCSTSRAAPIVDGLIAGYQVFRTAYAATASESTYRDAPISREADVLLGLGFTGLFLASTIYGGVNTSRCRRLKEGPGPDEELTGVTEEWTSTPQAPAPAPAASGAPAQPAAEPAPPAPAQPAAAEPPPSANGPAPAPAVEPAAPVPPSSAAPAQSFPDP